MTVKVISNALSIKLGIVFNDNNMDFFVISELTPSPLDNADTVEDFSFKRLARLKNEDLNSRYDSIKKITSY